MQKTALMTTAVALMFFMTPAAAMDLELNTDDLALLSSGNYIGLGTGDVNVFCQVESETGYCLGGYTFSDVANGDVKIDISDATGAQVSAAALVDGEEVPFCGSTTIEDFQGGPLTVFIDGPRFAATGNCPTELGTEGTISITEL